MHVKQNQLNLVVKDQILLWPLLLLNLLLVQFGVYFYGYTQKEEQNLRLHLMILLKWFLLVFVLLVVGGVLVAIQLPAVQNWAVQKGTAWLSKKIGSRVALANLRVEFPKTIVLEGLYVETPAPAQDTLLQVGSLKVDIGMWGLLKKKWMWDRLS